MEVKELIKKLEEYPPEMRVVVSGYEGGVNDLEELKKVKVELNVNTAWYYGKHEETEKAWGIEVLHLY